MVQRWVSHRDLRLIVYCCHLLTEPDQTCKDFLILFFFLFFFRWKYKTNPVVLNCQIKFLYSKHYRHKTKYIKKAKTRKTLSASDTAIHSEGFEFGVHWITDGKSGSNTSSLLFLTVSLCFLLPSTNDNKSPLWSWCRPPGWHFHPQHPSSNTEKHIVLTDSMSSFPLWFIRRFWIHSFTPVLCCFVSFFLHYLLCSGSLVSPFFSECALISTNSYKYDGQTECSV